MKDVVELEWEIHDNFRKMGLSSKCWTGITFRSDSNRCRPLSLEQVGHIGGQNTEYDI